MVLGGPFSSIQFSFSSPKFCLRSRRRCFRPLPMGDGAASSSSSHRRRLRAFQRWMSSQIIDCSDALRPIPSSSEEISVRAVCDLSEGDLVATIPKKSCLTIKNSGACHVIQLAGLDDDYMLGLSVAIMYEKSLGHQSPWYPYLQLLPSSGELIPLFWTQQEIDSLLAGTELHKIVEEDKVLFQQDWEEYILPLVDSASIELDSDFFGLEQYFAARSLISSRSFQVDDYHGFGMVPLADLFNHKTAAENVHITSASSHPTSESYIGDINTGDECESPHDEGEVRAQSYPQRKSDSEDTLEASSSSLEEDPSVLEIVIVKAVRSGSEVFNTYGSLGNAALLHRYGFTELDNPYDIVNIDLELVLQWSSSWFSDRHSRARLSLWRKYNSEEYFEISFEGEPQIELLILLYILLLPEETFFKLDLAMSAAAGTLNGSISAFALLKNSESKFSKKNSSEISDDEIRSLLLTGGVCDALFSLANIREGLYGSSSIEDDVRALGQCCCIRERKLYYSLILRISERRILQKLREYATSSARLSRKKRKVNAC